MDFLQVKETCIYVSDLKRTRTFYNEKLGLQIISIVDGRHIFFRAGSSVLLCFIADMTSRPGQELPTHGASGSIHFALEVKVEDYDNAKKEILQKGIHIEQEQRWKNNLHSFYFRDPDGHLVEIIQAGLWD